MLPKIPDPAASPTSSSALPPAALPQLPTRPGSAEGHAAPRLPRLAEDASGGRGGFSLGRSLVLPQRLERTKAGGDAARVEAAAAMGLEGSTASSPAGVASGSSLAAADSGVDAGRTGQADAGAVPGASKASHAASSDALAPAEGQAGGAQPHVAIPHAGPGVAAGQAPQQPERPEQPQALQATGSLDAIPMPTLGITTPEAVPDPAGVESSLFTVLAVAAPSSAGQPAHPDACGNLATTDAGEASPPAEAGREKGGWLQRLGLLRSGVAAKPLVQMRGGTAHLRADAAAPAVVDAAALGGLEAVAQQHALGATAHAPVEEAAGVGEFVHPMATQNAASRAGHEALNPGHSVLHSTFGDSVLAAAPSRSVNRPAATAASSHPAGATTMPARATPQPGGALVTAWPGLAPLALCAEVPLAPLWARVQAQPPGGTAAGDGAAANRPALDRAHAAQPAARASALASASTSASPSLAAQPTAASPRHWTDPTGVQRSIGDRRRGVGGLAPASGTAATEVAWAQWGGPSPGPQMPPGASLPQ